MEKIPDNIYTEVKNIYLKQIDVPDVKPPVQYLLCPIGLTGAGKTTIVKPLAKKLNLVRVSGDEIRKLFKEKGFGYDRAKELAFDIVEKFLEKGFSVAIDSDCITEESQRKIAEGRKKFSFKIIWIHINPPEEFILNKLRGLKPNWLGTAEQMLENYYQRKPLHKNLRFPFLYTFDTSRKDVTEQIEEAKKLITDSLKL